MKRFTIANAHIDILTQSDAELTTHQCLTGIMSMTAEGYKFEEAVRKGRPPHNPKLYDGRYITMVRAHNGNYRWYLKTLTLPGQDHRQIAQGVYAELLQAFSIITEY